MIPFIIFLFMINYKTLSNRNKNILSFFVLDIENTNTLLKSIISEPLWNFDYQQVKDYSEYVFKKKEIIRIKIEQKYDIKPIVYLEKLENQNERYEFIVSKIDIEKEGKIIGKIEVVYTKKYIEQEIKLLYRNFNTFLLFIVFIFIVTNIMIFLFIYKPIGSIVNALKKVDDGNYQHRLYIGTKDEFKIIEDYFNNMIENLEKKEKESEKYIKENKEKSLELKEANDKLKQTNNMLRKTLDDFKISENKYRNIFNYSPDGMLLFNLEEKKVDEFNREFLNITGLNSIDTINLNLENIFYEKDYNEIIRIIDKEEVIYNMEVNLKKSEKDVIMSVIPLEKQQNMVQMVFKDISDLKKLQKELEEYAKSLENKVKERTKELEKANIQIREHQDDMVKAAYNRGLIEVTSGIIHNMGNIINILNLNLEELTDQLPKSGNTGIKFLREIVFQELIKIDNKSKNLEKIMDIFPGVLYAMEEMEENVKLNLKQIAKKISHLKEIVQLQQNFVGGLGTEDYNYINDILKESLEVFYSSISKRNIKLSINYCESMAILCDKSQLFQVFSNFIKNAYEAIDEKGNEDGEIEIKTEIEKENMMVIIKDNGTGIKEEDLNNVFEFGFSTKKNTGKGSGFGLNSSKNIVQKYGGKIEVDSKYGEWTEFKIIFPIDKNIF